MTDREQVAALLRRHTLAMVEHSPPSLIEDMGHCWRVQCSCGETFNANTVEGVLRAHCDHLADVLSASDAGATRAEDDVARDLDLEAIERRARELWSARFHEDMRGYPWQQHNGVPSPFRSWAHEQAYRAALAASSRAPSPPDAREQVVRAVSQAVASDQIEPYSEHDDGQGMEASVRRALEDIDPAAFGEDGQRSGQFAGGLVTDENPGGPRFVEDAPSPPAPADEPECCASGRCEVCTPGFVWGRNG